MGFLAPLGIKLGVDVVKGLFGKDKEREQAEANRADFDEGERRRVESERIRFGDVEDLRTTRGDELGNALRGMVGGDFAISPAMQAALAKRRTFSGFERTPGQAPPVGGFGSDLLGSALSGGSNVADSYLKGLATQAPQGEQQVQSLQEIGQRFGGDIDPGESIDTQLRLKPRD